jgi:hypothetical protein
VTSNELAELECPGDTDDFAVDEQRLALLVAAAAPTDWRSLSSGERGECWRELREWVAWLRRELVLDHRVVPPCWYRHTALVSVLSALHDRWRHAYDALNPLPGPSDWHHTFQQLEPRLREWSSRTGCTVAVHRPDVVLDYPDDKAEWNSHVESDIAARAEHEADGAADAEDADSADTEDADRG